MTMSGEPPHFDGMLPGQIPVPMFTLGGPLRINWDTFTNEDGTKGLMLIVQQARATMAVELDGEIGRQLLAALQATFGPGLEVVRDMPDETATVPWPRPQGAG